MRSKLTRKQVLHERTQFSLKWCGQFLRDFGGFCWVVARAYNSDLGNVDVKVARRIRQYDDRRDDLIDEEPVKPAPATYSTLPTSPNQNPVTEAELADIFAMV